MIMSTRYIIQFKSRASHDAYICKHRVRGIETNLGDGLYAATEGIAGKAISIGIARLIKKTKTFQSEIVIKDKSPIN